MSELIIFCLFIIKLIISVFLRRLGKGGGVGLPER